MATSDPATPPTTQSVVVQPSAPAPMAIGADIQAVGEWAGAAIAIATVFTLVGKLLDRAIGRSVDMLRRDLTDVVGKVAGNTGAIVAVQTKISDFMPRAEIEQRDGEVKRIAEKALEQAGNLREAHGRLDTRVDGIASEVRDLGTTMRDRFDKLDAKIDRIIEIAAKRG